MPEDSGLQLKPLSPIVLSARPVTMEEVRRVRLRAAEKVDGDAEALSELLDMLGIGPEVKVTLRDDAAPAA